MSEFDYIHITSRLIALAVLLQSIELIQIREAYSDNGIWKWSTLEQEFCKFPAPLRKLLELTLKTPNFNYLLFSRAVAAILSLITFNSLLIIFLLISTILIGLRWRGVFNGGSDYMTIVVLSALTAASLFPENSNVAIGTLLYIAIQSCSSYFISGIVKIKTRNWLSGLALPTFLSSGVYKTPGKLVSILSKKPFAILISWGAILFECIFPLALLNPSLALAFTAAGLIFHLTNFYIFGLNRFLFAWAATYPAIYFVSSYSP